MEPQACPTRFAMITATYVPLFITLLFRGLPGILTKALKNSERRSVCVIADALIAALLSPPLRNLIKRIQYLIWRWLCCSYDKND
jgi:hypothetical protein